MKNLLTLILCAGPLALPLFAQRGGGEAVNSLSRARSTFDAADFDKDQKLNFEELGKQRLGIQKADFDAMDADKNGTWSRDEFTVFYRRLLLNGSQRPAADLDAEVTRIQAMRKAKAENTPRRGAAPPPKVDTAASDARLQAAIDELEKKSALRQATRADFDRVREAMTSRATAGENAADTADLKAKFEAALARLEAATRAGTYSREEFNALRAALIRRGREAANEPAPPNEILPEADARLQSALDDLARKAEAKQATRDDFNRVRDAWAVQNSAASKSADPATAQQLSVLASRFGRAMDELEQQAAAGNWSREKFEAMRAAYIRRAREAASGANAPAAVPPAASETTADADARLQVALDELARKAEAKQATREDFDRVRETWTARAKAAGADPAVAAEQSALAAKFARAMEELEKEAAAGNWSREKFEAMRATYIHRARASVGAGTPVGTGSADAAAPAEVEKRFEEALDTLEKRAAERTATPADFQRVNDLVEKRARVAVKGPDGVSPADPNDPRIAALSAQLKEALARLEKAAQAGAISREDFAALRKMYVTRAREAAGDVKDAKGPGSGRGARPADEKKPEPKPSDRAKTENPPKPVDPPKTETPPAPEPKTEDVGSRGTGEKPPPAPEPPKDGPKEGRPESKPPHRRS